MTDPWLSDVPAVFRALADPRLENAIPRPAIGPLSAVGWRGGTPAASRWRIHPC